jgi:hypothetical protein
MSRVAEHRKIRSEIDLLVSQRILSDDQAAKLRERYPTEPWDLVSLAHWLTLLGAIAAGGGVILLGAKLESWRTLLEVSLVAVTAGLLWLARWLGNKKGMTRTRAALELCASFALQGLTVELAVHYSTGSENWPGLVGAQAALAGILAYSLGNRLVLIHALVNLFVFFGGETGYISGWGAYWLGMNYPLRFFVAGLASLGVAYAHARLPKFRDFSRVYLHFGLLIAHFAMWFFSVFGYFEKDIQWNGTEGQRAAFSIAWAAMSIGSIWLGGKIGLATLRRYGMVFLVIDVYTFYFQFVVANSPILWWLHLLLVGGTLVLIALRVEKMRKETQPDERQAL